MDNQAKKFSQNAVQKDRDEYCGRNFEERMSFSADIHRACKMFRNPNIYPVKCVSGEARENGRNDTIKVIIEEYLLSQLTDIYLLIKRKEKNRKSVVNDVKKLKTFCIADGNIKLQSCCGKWYGNSSKKLSIELPNDLEIPLLGIYTQKQ